MWPKPLKCLVFAISESTVCLRTLPYYTENENHPLREKVVWCLHEGLENAWRTLAQWTTVLRCKSQRHRRFGQASLSLKKFFFPGNKNQSTCCAWKADSFALMTALDSELSTAGRKSIMENSKSKCYTGTSHMDETTQNVLAVFFISQPAKQDVLKNPSSCLSLPWFTVRRRDLALMEVGAQEGQPACLVTSHLQLIPSLRGMHLWSSLCFYSVICLLNVSLCALCALHCFRILNLTGHFTNKSWRGAVLPPNPDATMHLQETLRKETFFKSIDQIWKV